jgi:hypothetical protein
VIIWDRVTSWLCSRRGARRPSPSSAAPMDPKVQIAQRAELVAYLLLLPDPWIRRCVETLVTEGQRRYRRRLSIDFDLPTDVRRLARQIGPSFCVPLALMKKDTRLSLDIVDAQGHALPLLTRDENCAVGEEVLWKLVSRLGPRDDDAYWKGLIKSVVNASEGLGRFTCALTHAETSGRFTAMNELTLQDITWMATLLDRNFLLLCEIPMSTLDVRCVVKISQTDARDDLKSEKRSVLMRLTSAMGWSPVRVRFLTTSWSQSVSYHFEFHAPEGLELAIPRVSPQIWSVAGIGGNSTMFNVALVQKPAQFLESGSVTVRLFPTSRGLVRSATITAALTSVLLWGAWASASRFVSLGVISTGNSTDAATALLLLAPGIIAAFLVRPGEHALVTELLSGVRLTTIIVGLIPVVGAAILAVHPTVARARDCFEALAICGSVVFVSLAATLIQAMWWHRKGDQLWKMTPQCRMLHTVRRD